MVEEAGALEESIRKRIREYFDKEEEEIINLVEEGEGLEATWMTFIKKSGSTKSMTLRW